LHKKEIGKITDIYCDIISAIFIKLSSKWVRLVLFVCAQL